MKKTKSMTRFLIKLLMAMTITGSIATIGAPGPLMLHRVGHLLGHSTPVKGRTPVVTDLEARSELSPGQKR